MNMSETERDFLINIRGAVFANPFGQTRMEIDLSASGLSGTDDKDEVLAKLIHKVGKTLQNILERSDARSSMSKEDLDLLRLAMLFHVFHLFCDNIDTHIQEQIVKDSEICRVHFADNLLKLLHNYGFSRTESIRFFELFFQMRRAFFFISKIVGSSNCVMNLRRILWNNVFTCNIQLYEQHLWDRMEDFSTMILGETGTGKGLAAAAIGRSGYIPFDEKSSTFRESFAQSFISINLSQYPEQLIESELFGHKKGAFTGAVESHKGLFSRCSPHGSIFLDEIGDVSVPVQIKLLQVLQDRQFSPVGSHGREKFNGRVIGATNQSLQEARKNGKFRDDFYYRLCSDVIYVPPLRQRIQENNNELQELLNIVVKRILGSDSSKIVSEIKNYILQQQPHNYHWPGNIRELEQCVRQVLLNKVYSWQLPDQEIDRSIQLAAEMEEGALSATELLSHYCRTLYEKHGTYEAVAQLTELDRRTVKKYIMIAQEPV